MKSAHDIGDPTLIAKKIVDNEDQVDVDSSLNGASNKMTSQIDYDLLKSKLKKSIADEEIKQTMKRHEDVDEKKIKS